VRSTRRPDLKLKTGIIPSPAHIAWFESHQHGAYAGAVRRISGRDR
jgi:hypothetical protein